MYVLYVVRVKDCRNVSLLVEEMISAEAFAALCLLLYDYYFYSPNALLIVYTHAVSRPYCVYGRLHTSDKVLDVHIRGASTVVQLV